MHMCLGHYVIEYNYTFQVRYLPNNLTFNGDNLEVLTELRGKTVTWRPAPAATATLNGNLLGTIRVICSG